MKTASKIFLFLGLFYVPLIFIYGYFSHWNEPVGVVALGLSAGFGLMMAGYFAVTEKKVDLSPSDRLDGEIDDFSGELGFFAPYSWTPLWLAAAISLFALGAAVGWWLVFISAPLICIAVVLWVFEFFTGPDAV